MISLLIIAVISLFFKELQAISFDPTLARTLRLPVRLFDYGLLILIALTIVVSLEVVGVSLMLAMLVTPAATATFFYKPATADDVPERRHRGLLRRVRPLRLFLFKYCLRAGRCADRNALVCHRLCGQQSTAA